MSIIEKKVNPKNAWFEQDMDSFVVAYGFCEQMCKSGYEVLSLSVSLCQAMIDDDTVSIYEAGLDQTSVRLIKIRSKKDSLGEKLQYRPSDNL